MLEEFWRTPKYNFCDRISSYLPAPDLCVNQKNLKQAPFKCLPMISRISWFLLIFLLISFDSYTNKHQLSSWLWKGAHFPQSPPPPPRPPSPHAQQCNMHRAGLVLLSCGFSAQTLFHPLRLCWNWWLLKPKLECVNLLRKWVLEPSRKWRGLSTFASTDSNRLLESPSLLGSDHSSLSALLLFWLISDLSFSVYYIDSHSSSLPLHGGASRALSWSSLFIYDTFL